MLAICRNLALIQNLITNGVGVNILDENGESYLVTPFNHAAQQERAATGKHAFAGTDIDTAFAEEVVELGQKVRSHDADQLLHLSGQHRGLIPDDLVDLALFQDASVLRVALACNAVVEGDHTLFETLHNFKVWPAKAQFQDINGESADINDIRDGVRLQGAVLRDSGSKCLRIAQNLIDANGVVLSIVLKVNGLPTTQEVLLEAAMQLFVMCGRQTNQERDVDGIQSFRNIPILQFLRNRKEG